MELKKCSKCGKEKPLNEFYTSRKKCRACYSEEDKQKRAIERAEWLLNNPIVEKVKEIPTHKLCPKCNEDKDISNFGKAKNRADGYNGWCKSCVKKKVGELVDSRVGNYKQVDELTCTTCNETKTVSEFHKHRRYETGYYPECAACIAKKKDPEVVSKQWASFRDRIVTERYKENVLKILNILGGKCVVCGMEATVENFPAFDIHHIDPNTKVFAISGSYITNKWHRSTELELKKCELLCACCHRLKHFYDKDLKKKIEDKNTERLKKKKRSKQHKQYL